MNIFAWLNRPTKQDFFTKGKGSEKLPYTLAIGIEKTSLFTERLNLNGLIRPIY